MTRRQNLSTAERGISGTLGTVALSAIALRRAHPVIRVGMALLGLGLLARAVSGHCAVKAALSGNRSRGNALADPSQATKGGRRGDDPAPGERAVDDSIEGTFPASDPPASRLPDEPPSNAEDKWQVSRAAGKPPF